MAGIFISYRREDSRHAAGRLVDRLAQVFPREQLFMDIDAIEPGLDFLKVIEARLADCDVLLAVIGPNWADARDEDRTRRLDNPDDLVRLELEAALSRDIRVIPVLVDGAQLPKADSLPEGLRPLVRRNAVGLAHERFGAEADSLAQALATFVKRRAPVAEPTRSQASAQADLSKMSEDGGREQLRRLIGQATIAGMSFIGACAIAWLLFVRFAWTWQPWIASASESFFGITTAAWFGILVAGACASLIAMGVRLVKIGELLNGIRYTQWTLPPNIGAKKDGLVLVGAGVLGLPLGLRERGLFLIVAFFVTIFVVHRLVIFAKLRR